MKISKSNLFEFIVIVLRWYLAYYMIYYGYTKLFAGQFGVYNPKMAEVSLNKLNKFYIAWYLFSLSRTFDITIGIFQILGGLLIVINRTAIIGALFLLPIIFQILIIDVSFTTGMLGYALPIRMFWMIVSDIIILFFYRQKLGSAVKIIYSKAVPEISFSWWVYPIILFLGIITDFFWGIISIPIKIWLLH